MTSTMIHRRNRALIGGMLIGGLMLSGCSTAGGGAADADTITWATSGPSSVLDIAHGFNGPSFLVQTAVLETPVTLDAEGAVVPQLAKSWTEPSPGTYVFKLRSGVKFSDGSLMTADDVAYSLQRQTDPAIASQAASLVSGVKSVKATGPDEVTVVLSSPSSTFLANAAFAWQVVPKKLGEAHPKDLGTPEVPPVGTGPYRVTKFSLTKGVTLKRNAKYWGPKPAIGTVKVTEIADPEARRLAISSGSVDGTLDVGLKDARKWTGLKDAATRFYPSNSIAMLSLNVKEPHLADIHVRRAIAYAVNRAALQKLAAGDEADPASALLTLAQLTAFYGGDVKKVTDALPSYPYNPALAKAELAKSAYPSGFKMTSDEIAGGDNSNALQSIAADLAKIGIKVSFKSMPRDAYYAKQMRHEKLTLGLREISYGTPDPGELLPDLLSSESAKPQGFNYAQYSSPELDARLVNMLGLAGAKRQQAVTDILTTVAEDLPYIPLYYVRYGVAVNKRFTENIGTWTLNVFSEIKPAKG